MAGTVSKLTTTQVDADPSQGSFVFPQCTTVRQPGNRHTGQCSVFVHVSKSRRGHHQARRTSAYDQIITWLKDESL